MAERRTDFPMPLFDRLIDRELHFGREVRPLRTVDRAGLKESVRRELARLVNCRVQRPWEELESRPRTVIDYGIPDFGNISAANHEHRERLARLLARTIEHFEPRLERVRVELIPPGVDASRLRGTIQAMLIVGEAREPIAFATTLSDDSGEVYEVDGR